MDLDTAINNALEGQTLLFAGSGFSFGAKNISGGTFNVGDKLRDVIAADCGIGSQRPLPVTSEYYITEKSEDDLIRLLKKEFSVSEVASWHDELLSIPWKRIYTTNYDSVIELAAEHNERKLTPVVLSNNLSDIDLYNVCIHLNGHIDRLNRDTLNNEFKLIDTSYSCDALEGNEWFELFKGDLQTAKSIIIIGYSMQFDIDIKRLLSTPSIKSKVVFIDSPSPDAVDKRLLERYGDCEFIGIENFSTKITEIQETFVPPLVEDAFQSFIHEYRATLSTSNLSFKEITDFYTCGSFSDSLMRKDHGDYKYLIMRTGVNFVAREFRNSKVFLATSNLGNGKTLFCNLVRNELRDYEVDVFMLNHVYNDTELEIQRITAKQDRHSIVIIDNYKSKLDLLKRFRYHGIDNITFVLTTRKSVNPSYRSLVNALGVDEQDIRPVFLDLLDSSEIDRLSLVIANNGLYNSRMMDTTEEGIKGYIRETCHSRFADLLLEAYNSSDIKQRIHSVWVESTDIPLSIKRLAILALMKSVIGMDFNFSEMLNLLKLDYTLLPAKDNEFLNEFFSVESDDIRIRSSVVSRELLRSVIGIDELIDVMKTAMVEANKEYRVNGSYLELLKNLVSHSHFRMFEITSENQRAIMSFYDGIRNLSFCKESVFYWEQFASACIDTRSFETANQCIENAFARAKEIPGFVPFHIENIKANYLIEKLLFDIQNGHRPNASDALNVLSEIHGRLIKHFNHPDNTMSYTFRVGSKYVKIYEEYSAEFDKREKSIYQEKKNNILKLMKAHRSDSAFINHPLEVWIRDLDACS